MSFYKLLLVGAGGFLGSVMRYVTAQFIDAKINSLYPFGTFTVNLVGSFILGVVVGWSAARGGDYQNLKLLLITGFCGGFTTFSAFAFENMNLIDQKMTVLSLTYIMGSLVVGVLAVTVGIATGKGLS